MNKILILVEGITDLIFIKDFILYSYNFGFKEVTDKKFNFIELIVEDSFVIKIQNLGGKTKLSNIDFKKNIIAEINRGEYSGILIFYDADYIVNNEGIDFTKNLLNTQIGDSFDYDYFIFPNNSDSEGTIEYVLENIIKKDHIGIFECWDNFEKCVNSKSEDYNLPAKKSKIYVYLECLYPNTKQGKEFVKDKGRDYKNGYWDLENKYLNSLKEFLDKYIKNVTQTTT